MNYLLDSHTLIWAIVDPQKLPAKIRHVLEDRSQDIFVSTVSFWEISLKYALGKLNLQGIVPEEFPELAKMTGFELLSLEPEESSSFHRLDANWHRDPFDRMLIWQALKRNLTFISKDKDVKRYQSIGLKVLWQ
ncbi:type II toxin-antitoxin system VapC family toxin [Olivibacter sitiensis]|uniref:type II toxin-antitoxin system VapC family toxin n=1 Tax=Olivibacter sitiensis TaxID=376470 RepID=UPI0004223E72|nr:type II toxin-antitoxin system VapC family toxin [Olivibacter sitiensis]